MSGEKPWEGYEMEMVQFTRMILDGSYRNNEDVSLKKKVQAKLLEDIQSVRHMSGAEQLHIDSLEIETKPSYFQIVPPSGDNDDGLKQVTVVFVIFRIS